MIIIRWILLKIRNISDKFVKKIKTRILFSIKCFPENNVVYEIMWKNMAQPERKHAIKYGACA
jgi:hypothetical protein